MSTRALNARRSKNRKSCDTQAGDGGSAGPGPPSSHVDVPPFVSAALRRYVVLVEGFEQRPNSEEVCLQHLATAQRLRTDPRMRRVWRTLERYRGPDGSVIFEFVQCACGTEVTEFTVKDLTNQIDYALGVAESCRMLAFCRSRNDPTLSAAFTRVAEHFEKNARDAKRRDPTLLMKSRGKNHDVRSYVRILGRETHRLFGATLYRTVATTASVSLERPITWQQVRNWCKIKPRKPRSRK